MRIVIQYTPETTAQGDKPIFVSSTDGDTPTIQTPIRMLGVDAPELHYAGAGEDNPGKFDAALAGFLGGAGSSLDAGLKAHLAERLDASASTRHIQAGAAAAAHFRRIVDERLRRVSQTSGAEIRPRKLFTMVSKQVFDHYGRLLAYVAPAYSGQERKTLAPEQRPTFNLQMMQDGHATSLIIYPNLPKPDDLKLVNKAIVSARRGRRGLWRSATPTLLAFEYRWIVDTLAGKREGPNRFCGDVTTGKLYLPQHYYKVPDQNRIWFFDRDVGAAVALGFKLRF